MHNWPGVFKDTVILKSSTAFASCEPQGSLTCFKRRCDIDVHLGLKALLFIIFLTDSIFLC